VNSRRARRAQPRPRAEHPHHMRRRDASGPRSASRNRLGSDGATAPGCQRLRASFSPSRPARATCSSCWEVTLLTTATSGQTSAPRRRGAWVWRRRAPSAMGGPTSSRSTARRRYRRTRYRQPHRDDPVGGDDAGPHGPRGRGRAAPRRPGTRLPGRQDAHPGPGGAATTREMVHAGLGAYRNA